jgi:hypothetical protein
MELCKYYPPMPLVTQNGSFSHFLFAACSPSHVLPPSWPPCPPWRAAATGAGAGVRGCGRDPTTREHEAGGRRHRRGRRHARPRSRRRDPVTMEHEAGGSCNWSRHWRARARPRGRRAEPRPGHWEARGARASRPLPPARGTGHGGATRKAVGRRRDLFFPVSARGGSSTGTATPPPTALPLLPADDLASMVGLTCGIEHICRARRCSSKEDEGAIERRCTRE